MQTLLGVFPLASPLRVISARRLLTALVMLVALLPVLSARADSPPLSRAEADHLLGVLKDPAQRAQFMTTLEEYARAAPGSALPTTPATGEGATTGTGSHSTGASSNAGATTAAGAPGTGSPPKPTSNPGAFTRTLRAITAATFALVDHLSSGFRALTDWSALTAWIDAMSSQTALRADALSISLRVLAIGFACLLLEWALRRYLAGRNKAAAPDRLSRPVSPLVERSRKAARFFGSNLLVLACVGILGYGGIFATLSQFPVGRSIAFGVLCAYLAVRLTMTLFYTAFSPDLPAARLLPFTDMGAREIVRIARLLAVTVAVGFVAGEIVADLGATDQVRDSIQKLVALIVHLLLIITVLRTRRPVAQWIRRRCGDGHTMKTVGDALAAAWPFVAVTAIAAWWLVWAMDIPDGYQRILRFVVTTTAILIAGQLLASFLAGFIERRLTPLAEDGDPLGLPRRLGGYHRSIRSIVRIAIGLLTLIVLLQTWGIDAMLWFDPGHLGNRIGTLTLKLLLLAVIGIVCWEVADALVEARVARLMAESALSRATRLRTLQPIVRIALVVVLSLVVVLTALTEIGINVGPLLAGASIFGVALGFGSQKLVQDFITGIFLLVEDAMDVGDWVTVAGLSGSVEHLSIRTIRLRAGDGSVHLIPFSAVTSVTNTNRGIGNAAVNVTVDAGEDTDRVARVLSDIVAQMRTEEAFASGMRSDLQLWGVDKVDGGTITIAGQIVCTDASRWPVQREFNRRLKLRFEQEGIALGVPHQSLLIERPERHTSMAATAAATPTVSATPAAPAAPTG